MRISVSHLIRPDPEPEDAGTITVFAEVDGFGELYLEPTLVEEFLEDRLKEDLNFFLIESGINDDDTYSAMVKIIHHVDELTSSPSINYSPGCALKVFLSITYDPQSTEEAIRVNLNETMEDDFIFDSDHQIQEVLRASFNETNTAGLRPASKLAVGSLNRKIYKKTSEAADESPTTCTICLEEFKEGRSIVTLPCGHMFDDECVVEWFLSSLVCPLCRFELPYER